MSIKDTTLNSIFLNSHSEKFMKILEISLKSNKLSLKL